MPARPVARAPHPREAAEFRRLLLELGWSRASLARRLGLLPNTVQKWVRPPRYALAYVRLAVRLRRFSEEFGLGDLLKEGRS